MEKKTKMLIGVLAVLMVALPLVAVTTFAADGEPEDCFSGDKRKIRRSINLRERKPRRVLNFFKRCHSATVEGTVVTHSGRILVVNASEEMLNIVLPIRWNVGEEVVGVFKVFNESYIQPGDSVVVSVLERAEINEQGVSITILWAYEIVDSTSENHLYAVLPFNVQTES